MSPEDPSGVQIARPSSTLEMLWSLGARLVRAQTREEERTRNLTIPTTTNSSTHSKTDSKRETQP